MATMGTLRAYTPGAVTPLMTLCIIVIYNKYIFGHSDDENRFLMCI